MPYKEIEHFSDSFEVGPRSSALVSHALTRRADIEVLGLTFVCFALSRSATHHSSCCPNRSNASSTVRLSLSSTPTLESPVLLAHINAAALISCRKRWFMHAYLIATALCGFCETISHGTPTCVAGHVLLCHVSSPLPTSYPDVTL